MKVFKLMKDTLVATWEVWEYRGNLRVDNTAELAGIDNWEIKFKPIPWLRTAYRAALSKGWRMETRADQEKRVAGIITAAKERKEILEHNPSMPQPINRILEKGERWATTAVMIARPPHWWRAHSKRVGLKKTIRIMSPMVRCLKALDPDLQEVCLALVEQSKQKLEEQGLELYSQKEWFEQLDVDWEKYPNLKERLNIDQ
jgi:hypothetical protein